MEGGTLKKTAKNENKNHKMLTSCPRRGAGETLSATFYRLKIVKF